MFPWQSASSGQRGDARGPSQPPLGALATRPLPAPAPRQRRHRPQRRALPRRHRRPGLPLLQRRRADGGDRPLLGQRRHLRPHRGPLRDPGGGRSRRVPRGPARRRPPRRRQQRLHQRDGGLGPLEERGDPRPPRRPPPRGDRGQAGDHRRGAGALGRDQPPDAGLLPRRRHQPVRGLRGPRGAGLGRLPGPLRQHPAPRPDPRGRGRHGQPLPPVEAGRRAHALLPVLADERWSSCSTGSATTVDDELHRPHDRLLPRPDLQRVDAEPGGARLGGGPTRPRAVLRRPSARRCAAISTTPRAEPPPKVSTSARWPAPST